MGWYFQFRSINTKRIHLNFVSFILFTLALVGCGKAGFQPSVQTRNMSGPGAILVPPNVDILVLVDQSGSMDTLIGELKEEVPKFLKGLENKNWNYHFAVAPLAEFEKVQQVAGSVYDGNYGASWVPPYPGAPSTGGDNIAPSAFRTAENFDHYITPNRISNSLQGREPGLENLYQMISQGLDESRFLREKSIFIVLIIGNGNDTSYVNFCGYSDSNYSKDAFDLSKYVSCNSDDDHCLFSRVCEKLDSKIPLCTGSENDPTGGQGKCGSSLSSLNYYASKIKSFKKEVRLFSAVSYQDTSNCRGTRAYAGSRYLDLTRALNGKTYDICTSSISSILTDLDSILRAEKVALKTKYLFVVDSNGNPQEPNPETIEVTIYPNGDKTQPIKVPRGAVNGWTYEGKVENVGAVYDPRTGVAVTFGSGFGILLHGSAELSDLSQATIQFDSAGAKRK